MYNIQVLDAIASKGLHLFDPKSYQVGSDFNDPDVILVRSHKLHNYSFSKNLKAVARAGAGTDNIPVEKLTALGIPVFYAPGANANAVKELVMAAMLMGYRHLEDTKAFIGQLTKQDNALFTKEMESQKKRFVGHEISGKTLGLVGLGNIGVKVANAALGLGMKVKAYDPMMTVNNALALQPEVEVLVDLNAVLTQADILTLHVPLNEATTNLINEKNIELIRPHTLVLNFSREAIVNENAILAKLNTEQLMGYITDFPTIHLAQHPKVLCFPHLGASTIEAEQGSAEMVIRNLINYLEFGLIEHSVNFPNITLAPIQLSNCHRFLIINQNIPGAMGEITQAISQLGFNIEQMENKSRGSVAVNLMDISGPKTNLSKISFKTIPSFLQARVIPL